MKDNRQHDLFEKAECQNSGGVASTGHAARTLRDAGMLRVLEKSGDWKEQASLFVSTLGDFKGTAEDLRLIMREKIGDPHHHNAWGGMINGAVRQGYLIKVDMGQMKTPKSHARSTPVYVSRSTWNRNYNN